MDNEFRVIPGYEGYSVSCHGVIKSIKRNLVLTQYMLNGYYIVDSFRGSLTETLPVHRAVALAWVMNTKPNAYTVVNHIDGIPTNNRWLNLEWTDYSGNNYHAVNNGLRNDNLQCSLRDYTTGKITTFSSVAQAAESMGYLKCTPLSMLRPKKYGTLLKDRYEFRHKSDTTPWFYEGRSERVEPTRYLVLITENGKTREVSYTTTALLKEYQLYDSPSKAIPELIKLAQLRNPQIKFEVKDSYKEVQHERLRQTKPSPRLGIRAMNQTTNITFRSLTVAAKYFEVDRSTIKNRVNTDKDFNGWIFIRSELPAQVARLE